MAHKQAYWLSEQDCQLDDFIRTVSRYTDLADYPLAAAVESNILVYDCDTVRQRGADTASLRVLQAEWGKALLHGPGVVVLKRAVDDLELLEQVNAVFQELIAEQHASGQAGGDHFARAGANDRIWNAQQKLCLRAPAVFADYFSNRMLLAVSEAWLGPCYQMTSQVNVVRPGGDAQQAHRDYHLGFQTVSAAERYPAHVHRMSAFLTLQGAVAHTDMPVESGPTKLLPYSQRYAEGYLAWRRADFREYFEEHFVQLPLSKGDAVFFNPALFHAAGANRTADVQRMANLLQVSSAYGRAMEVLDRRSMCEAVYPVLRERRALGRMSDAEATAAIASCAEGYPFPTDLDRNPPVGGLAPESQRDLMQRALDEDWEPARFTNALNEHASRSRTA